MYYYFILFLLALVFVCLFFFFKQKTAYEMRISDWSSDVCSSDLSAAAAGAVAGTLRRLARHRLPPARARRGGDRLPGAVARGRGCAGRRGPRRRHGEIGRASCRERVCQYV